jgi:hypothetical protein
MRKSVAISLLIIYIIFSSGVGVRMYYSSGHLQSINLVLDRSAATVCTQTVNEPAREISANKSAQSALPNSLKRVLHGASVVSLGFFEAYDITQISPACNNCAAMPIRPAYPAHMLSID